MTLLFHRVKSTHREYDPLTSAICLDRGHWGDGSEHTQRTNDRAHRIAFLLNQPVLPLPSHPTPGFDTRSGPLALLIKPLILVGYGFCLPLRDTIASYS